MKFNKFAIALPFLCLTSSFNASALSIQFKEDSPVQKIIDSRRNVNTLDFNNDKLESILLKIIESKSSHKVANATRFFAIALQVWNPSLNSNDIEKLVEQEVKSKGILKGLLEPALILIDLSYAADRARFGNLLGPMLNELSPKMAEDLRERFGLPIEDKLKPFAEIMKLTNREIKSSMERILGDNFSQSEKINLSNNPTKDFMYQAIVGRGSFTEFAEKNMESEFYNDDIINNQIQEAIPRQTEGVDEKLEQHKKNKRLNKKGNKAPINDKYDLVSRRQQNTDNETDGEQAGSGQQPKDNSSTPKKPRGIFSKIDLVAKGPHACAATCAADIGTGVAAGIGAGVLVPNPWGPGVGAAVGAAIGAGIGGFHCSQSDECSPDPKPSEPQNNVPPKNTGDSTPRGPKNSSNNGSPMPKDSGEPKPSTEPKDNQPKDGGGQSSPPKENDPKPTSPKDNNGNSDPKDDDDSSNSGEEESSARRRPKNNYDLKALYDPDKVDKDFFNSDEIRKKKFEGTSTPKSTKDF